jgi:hypothetical protein
MRKRDLKVFRLAVELAGTGKYRDWKAIEEKLVNDGYHRAPDLLDGGRIQAILDLRCDESRKTRR